MEWFRFYHEVVDDPKVQRLAPPLFKHWVNLLCLAARNADRGTLPSFADLAFGLRLSEAKVRAIVADLEAAGLLDRDGETLRVHGWTRRQKRSDDVSTRVAKHRASNTSVTLQETLLETLPHVRVTETETETETDNDGTSTNAQAREKLPITERPPEIRPEPPDRDRIDSAYRAIYGGLGVKDGETTFLSRWQLDHLDLTPAVLASVTDDELRRCAAYLLSSWKRDGIPKTPRVKHVLEAMAEWRRLGEPVAAPPKQIPSINGKHPPSPPILQPGQVPRDGGLAEYKARRAAG